MPNLVGSTTIDTTSTDGNCSYPGLALGGTPSVSPKVRFDGAPVEYYHALSSIDPTTPVKINPLIPAPCQPGNRAVVPLVNTTVFIDGKLPAVQGDEAKLVLGGTLRSLTGPFKHPKIVFNTRR